VSRPRLRSIAVVAVAAAVVTGVSACEQHTGTVAYVGDTRITSSQLDASYSAAKSDPRSAQARQVSDADSRRNNLIALLEAAIFRAGATKEHVLPDEATVRRAQADPQIAGAALQYGIGPQAFAELSLFSKAIENKVTTEAPPLSPTATDQEKQAHTAALRDRFNGIFADVLKQNPITLNPRYGTFDPRGFFDSNVPVISQGGEKGIKILPATPSPQAQNQQQGENQQGQQQQGQDQQPSN
jgi:hypothetical protein